MLSKSVYLGLIQELHDNYRKECYGPSAIRIMYEHFKHYSDERFTKIVHRAIAENTYPPGMKEFESIAAMIREDDRADEKKQETKDANNMHKYITDMSKLVGEVQEIRKQMDAWLSKTDPYKKKK